MSAARQGWLQAALGAAAGAAAAALLLRRRQRSNLHASEELDSADDPLRRFRKTEAVIRRRNSRVVVVIERCNESHNCAARCHFLQSFGLASMAPSSAPSTRRSRSHTDSAVLRTAEALGYHHVWVVAPPTLDIDAAIAKRQPRRAKNVWKQDEDDLREHVAYAKRASKWLQLRFFADSEACVEALRADGREIWSTDLSQAAVCLTNAKLRLPARLAVVIGTESTGCSPTMLSAADRRIYMPLHGFADSLNLSVAAALLLQRLQDIDDSVVGDMSEAERTALRREWYPLMLRPTDDPEEIERLAASGGVPPLGDLRRTSSHRAGWLSKSVVKSNAERGQANGIGS